MNTNSRNVSRLSIRYLLAVTAAVGCSIAVARGIAQLRFAADSHFYNVPSVPELAADELLIAAIYGSCVATFLFAAKSADFWKSPGKTLSLLFATMCILNWTLELIAALIVQSRLGPLLSVQTDRSAGYILGTWYRDFAPAFGYIAAIPILVLALFKSNQQSLCWRFVWIGFLVFDLLIVGFMHFDLWKYAPSQISSRYFEIAMGIPVSLLAWAMIITIARRRPMDWWTASIGTLIIVAWSVGTAIRMA